MLKKKLGGVIGLAIFFLGIQNAQASRTLYPWSVGFGYAQNIFLNYSQSDDSVFRLGRFGFGGNVFATRQFSEKFGLKLDTVYNAHTASLRGTSKGITHVGTVIVEALWHFTDQPWGSIDPYVSVGPGLEVSTHRALDNSKSPYPILAAAFGIDTYFRPTVSMFSEIGSYFSIRYMIVAARIGFTYHFGHPKIVIFEE